LALEACLLVFLETSKLLDFDIDGSFRSLVALGDRLLLPLLEQVELVDECLGRFARDGPLLLDGRRTAGSQALGPLGLFGNHSLAGAAATGVKRLGDWATASCEI